MTSIEEALTHPWITGGNVKEGANNLDLESKRGKVKVSNADLNNAINAFKVKDLGTFINMKIQLKKLKFNTRRKLIFLREFHKCCRVGDLKNIKDMLNCTFLSKDRILNDCLVRDVEGRCPLHVTAMLDNAEATQLLLDEGAFPLCYTSEGTTPLHVAVENNKLNQINILISAGANPLEKRLSDGKTCVDISITSEAYDILTAQQFLHDIGKGQSHKKGHRHSVKNPFFASRSMSEYIDTRDKNNLEACIHIRFEKKRGISSMFRKKKWMKKFLRAKHDGVTALYKAALNHDEKMIIEEKMILYDNRENDTISRHDSIKNLMYSSNNMHYNVVDYCILNGFEKKHPFTIQLVIKGTSLEAKSQKKPVKQRGKLRYYFNKRHNLSNTSDLLQVEIQHVLVSMKDEQSMLAYENIVKSDICRMEKEISLLDDDNNDKNGDDNNVEASENNTSNCTLTIDSIQLNEK
eukprot:g7888.t1